MKATRRLFLSTIGAAGAAAPLLRKIARIFLFSLPLAPLLLAGAAPRAEENAAAIAPAPPDLMKQPTLYVVAYSHLDTQWRWDYVKTITDYIPATMRENFAMFEKYPHYLLNFSGSNRYQMMKDYYPADYARVKRYVAAGRWFPAGSSVEEGDVSLVSAEAILRQILYGNRFFQAEFGQSSAEYMLPDCFGFPATLPSILAHAGLKGFSTQKLSWLGAAPVGGPASPEQTPVGIPFNVGHWVGLDGQGVIAALNAEKYTGVVAQDLSRSPEASFVASDLPTRAKDAVRDWPRRVERNGKVSGLYTDYHYYGAGDVGGAPLEASIRVMEAIVTKASTRMPSLTWITARYPELPEPVAAGTPVQLGTGPLNVVPATAEQMFLDIRPEQAGGLPRYTGDLLLTKHSTGVLTSQAYMKRWNRQNELLADGAERASVGAEWLGGRVYPRERISKAWELVLAGHFHDILPGTSLPEAYEYSWNDEVLALNQFAGVLTDATGVIASRLDTRAKGITVVVYNPLNIQREDVVEVALRFPAGTPRAVRVVGPDGREALSQLTAEGRVLFLARVPSVGFAVFDVQAAEAPAASTLQITDRTLENGRYRIEVDANGDVARITDKRTRKELLAAPHRLAFQSQMPKQTPAWDFDWKDQKLPPRGFVGGPARVRIVERGPVRVALEITRDSEGSRFVQTVRLSAGESGERVEWANVIDWKTRGAALKATFPLLASNPEATYSWGIGSVRRGNNHERMYEVPAHQWFDLTDRSGTHGVTVLTDAKYGSDKPSDSTVRLTLVYSPGIDPDTSAKFLPDQATQDWGRHEFVYGLAGHAGDHRQAQTDWQALRLNQPLWGFVSPGHAGALGKTFSLLRVSDPRVRVLALKKAEASDEVVVRLVEMDGRAAGRVRVGFPAPVTSARQINGQEQPLGPARVDGGELVVDFTPSAMRSFAVKLAPVAETRAAPRSVPVALPYDLAVASRDGTPSTGGFDAEGRSLAAEKVPARISYSGVTFALAFAATEVPNAVVARGQEIALPKGTFTRVHLLAASAEGDQQATFRVGGKETELTIQSWGGFIGQWDNRRWSGPLQQGPPGYDMPGAPPPTFPEYLGLTPGFVKPAPVAWFASHRHDAKGGNQPYAYSYLFAYALDVPEGATSLTLPKNDRIRVLAMTVTDEGASVRPATPLYDMLDRSTTLARHQPR